MTTTLNDNEVRELLDRVDAYYAASTQGGWESLGLNVVTNGGWKGIGSCKQHWDVAFVVAAHRDLPTLATALRERLGEPQSQLIEEVVDILTGSGERVTCLGCEEILPDHAENCVVLRLRASSSSLLAGKVEKAATQIANNITYLEDMYAQEPKRAATEIADIIRRALKSVEMEEKE